MKKLEPIFFEIENKHLILSMLFNFVVLFFFYFIYQKINIPINLKQIEVEIVNIKPKVKIEKKVKLPFKEKVGIKNLQVAKFKVKNSFKLKLKNKLNLVNTENRKLKFKLKKFSKKLYVKKEKPKFTIAERQFSTKAEYNLSFKPSTGKLLTFKEENVSLNLPKTRLKFNKFSKNFSGSTVKNKKLTFKLNNIEFEVEDKDFLVEPAFDFSKYLKYPKWAIENKMEGIIKLRLYINKYGDVVRTEVLSAPAFVKLLEYTKNQILNWKFKVNKEGTVLVTIIYKLK